MICRKKEYQIGELVTVTHCWGGYRLPPALPDGAAVKILGREPGQTTVVYQGEQFVVSTANIKSGWEYRLKGVWRDESDPLIANEVQNKKSKTHKKLASFANQAVAAEHLETFKVDFDVVTTAGA